MRTIFCALVFLFLALQYEVWFSNGGVVSSWRLKRAIQEVQAQTLALKKRNDVLVADIQDLKNGNQAVEEHARNDLGMIKNGEVFYQAVAN